MKIKSIQLEVKDQLKVELSLEEAEELYKELDKLFGSKVHYYPLRDYWPYKPYGNAYTGVTLKYNTDE